MSSELSLSRLSRRSRLTGRLPSREGQWACLSPRITAGQTLRRHGGYRRQLLCDLLQRSDYGSERVDLPRPVRPATATSAARAGDTSGQGVPAVPAAHSPLGDTEDTRDRGDTRSGLRIRSLRKRLQLRRCRSPGDQDQFANCVPGSNVRVDEFRCHFLGFEQVRQRLADLPPLRVRTAKIHR